MGFIIKENRGHFDVFLDSRKISTADTLHEAEHDVEEYECIIENYKLTGSLPDWRAAVLFVGRSEGYYD